MAKVAIFPASGALGTSIYVHLLQLLDPKNVLLISRHPEKTPSNLLQAGVTTLEADYNAPESFHDVFKDVSTLVLVSYPSIEIEHRFNAHKAAIDAARRSGVSHIFYTSLAFGGDCSHNSTAHVMQAHLLTEAYLLKVSQAPGDRPFSFTVIREGIYSESLPMYTGFPSLHDLAVSKDQVFHVQIPHDGSGPGIAWACIDDLGEASAKLIGARISASSSHERNDMVLLTGPKAWTLAETLGMLGRITGNEIRLEQGSIEEYVAQPVVRQELGSHGPDDRVPMQWVTVFDALRRGECAVTSTELGRLLGREPEGLEQTVRKMVSNAS